MYCDTVACLYSVSTVTYPAHSQVLKATNVAGVGVVVLLPETENHYARGRFGKINL